MKQLETLLLQEMVDVKGGSTAGVCQCSTGALQSEKGDGTCLCTLGGAAQSGSNPNIQKCLCPNGGGAFQQQ